MTAEKMMELADEIDDALTLVLHAGNTATRSIQERELARILWDNKAGIVSALRSSAVGAGARETLRLVPIEPTPDMRIAGGIAWAEALPTAETYVDTADACYKAMIAAAPSLQSEPVQPAGKGEIEAWFNRLPCDSIGKTQFDELMQIVSALPVRSEAPDPASTFTDKQWHDALMGNPEAPAGERK